MASKTNKKKTLIDQMDYKLPKLRLCLVREGTSSRQATIAIRTPRDAIKYLEPLSMACEEHFVSLHLNAKHEVIGLHEVSHGTLSASLVHPREVFKAALMANSYAILVCHNHPSGSEVKPSLEDMDTTRQLVEAGRFIGVNVIDHLIIGPGSLDDWYSLRERHPDLWAVDQEGASM
ncbi:MAG: JAB domain-containing protein [Candidatus Melainabacteria bacterium]|nr:JAB domain-containing protein [Candidatus Melainabacteria bacterium]